MTFRARIRVLPLLTILAFGCDSSPAEMDASTGMPDSGPVRIDSGPRDAGPPPPMVPANGWTNAIAASDIAAMIMSGATTYMNESPDPSVAIGEPNGLPSAVALGDTGHFFVADLGETEEAFDGPGDDIDVR